MTIGAAIASAMTAVFTAEPTTWLPSPTSTVYRAPPASEAVWALNRIRPNCEACSGIPPCTPSPISERGTIGVFGAESDRATTLPSAAMTCTARMRSSVRSTCGAI